MASAGPTFLIFSSQPGADGVSDREIFYQRDKERVKWPRGRPRKTNRVRQAGTEGRGSYGFVNSSVERGSDDPATRRFIRAHVMHHHMQQKRGRLGDGAFGHGIGQSGAEAAKEDGLPPSVLECWPWDPFDCFPLKMQPFMHDLFHQYIYITSTYLYSLEAQWGFNPTERFWVPMALTDPLVLSAIMLSCEQFMGRMKVIEACRFPTSHLAQTIRALNERLNNTTIGDVADGTIASVAGLALIEQWGGNQESWRVHMKGLMRMMELRETPLTFDNRAVLYDKVCRADICGSLYDFSPPYLHLQPFDLTQPSHNEDPQKPSTSLSPGFQTLHAEHPFTPSLLTILSDLHSINQELNTAHHSPSESIAMLQRRRLRIIQNNLLHSITCNDESSPHDRAVRIGLLVHVGFVQNEFAFAPVGRKLQDELRSCICSEEVTRETHTMRALKLWLLFLADAILPDSTWTARRVSRATIELGLVRWEDVRRVLLGFAWVGRAQDEKGELLWGRAAYCGVDVCEDVGCGGDELD